MNRTQQSEILVIGATGKTGRRVAQRLTALEVPVRPGSRKAPRPFDWEDPGTWRRARAGTSAAYIAYYPDLGMPGAAKTVGEFAEYAEYAVTDGTRRLVHLSGRGEEGAVAAEEALKRSGADWTVVRAGELALPTADAVEPFVDAGDIADVPVYRFRSRSTRRHWWPPESRRSSPTCSG